MNNIDFSVIIPHFNSFNLLGKLIESIPNRREIEVIVVDDNSDNSDIKVFKKNYKRRENIKWLKNLYPKGAGGARNTGIENSKGKWILFADSDDFFLKGSFKIFEKYKNEEVDIIFFNCKSIFLDSQKEADRHIYYRKLVLDYLANSNKKNEKKLRYEFVVPWAKMISKQFINKYNLRFSNILVANDRMLSVQSGFYATSILASNEIVYCVTRTHGSLTTLQAQKFFEIRVNEILKINKFLIEKNEYSFRPYFIGFLFTSKNYGLKYSILLLKKIKKEKGKIFPNDFFKNFINGFYLKKIKEKVRERKYMDYRDRRNQ